MKKTEITMWDLRNEGMSDELYRYFSNSDYCVYEGGTGYDIYIGRDYCQTFPTITDVIDCFQELYADDHETEDDKTKTYNYLNYTNLKRYIIRDREAGNYIADFNTPEEALAQIREWEREDEADGIAEDNFYEVYDLEAEAQA